MPPRPPAPAPEIDSLLPHHPGVLREESAHVQKSGAGPVVSIVIIVSLLLVGGLYFWGAHLNAQSEPQDQLPLIPADDSPLIISTTTTP